MLIPLFVSRNVSVTSVSSTFVTTPVGSIGYTTSSCAPRFDAIVFTASWMFFIVTGSSCAKYGTECMICVFFAMMFRTLCPLNSGELREQSKSNTAAFASWCVAIITCCATTDASVLVDTWCSSR